MTDIVVGLKRKLKDAVLIKEALADRERSRLQFIRDELQVLVTCVESMYRDYEKGGE